MSWARQLDYDRAGKLVYDKGWKAGLKAGL